MGVSHQIRNTLKVYNKSESDIDHVIYATGPSCEKHTCSLAEFFDAVKDVDWAFDLVFPYEIKLVGKHYWIEFDYRNEWMVHSFPDKKYSYKKPSSDSIIRKRTFSDEDDFW
jgi:hypothetical protein